MEKNQKKYRAAVIGCGRIGMLLADDAKRPKPATHAGAYAGHPRIELAALVDPDEAKRKEAARLYPNARFFNNAEEMFKEIKPDVVSIAAFHSVHEPMVLLAAKHKTPVILSEKPLAETIPEGERMIAACRASGSKLIVNHIRRFDPFLQEWAKKVKEGIVGEVQQASAMCAIGLFHMGTHLIDLIRLYLGEVEWVSAFENRRAHTAVPGDWLVDGTLGLKSGAHLALQSLNVKDFSTLELRIIGAKGEVFVRDLGRVVEYTPVSESRDYGGFNELHVSARQQYIAKDQVFFKGMVDHVVDVLDGKAEPAATGEDALAALRVLIALRQSGEQDGKKIAL